MNNDACSRIALGRKLGESRMRLLRSQPFFGLLLMHMRYALDGECETACTDGRQIIFGESFLARLTPLETDFVLLHEIAHVALQHCFRDEGRDSEVFNIACDIVVNSLLLSEIDDFQGLLTVDDLEIAHLAPDSKEGCLYSAEEVYEMLMFRTVKNKKEIVKNRSDKSGGDSAGHGDILDDHSLWETGSSEERKQLRREWEHRLVQAALTVEVQQSSTSCGNMPLLAKRILGALRRPRVDWRALLHQFIQFEICDYSFAPPDRRFQDSLFLLPDWNERRETPGKLWFVVDTSGSVSDAAVATAYSEIYGALVMFNGALEAVLSFFDHRITEPEPFRNPGELLRLRPKGGGGTNFSSIFIRLKNKALLYKIVLLSKFYKSNNFNILQIIQSI